MAVPAWASATALTIASPRPAPRGWSGAAEGPATAARVKGSNAVGTRLGAMPGPSSGDLDAHLPRLDPDRDGHLAGAVLQGVSHQVLDGFEPSAPGRPLRSGPGCPAGSPDRGSRPAAAAVPRPRRPAWGGALLRVARADRPDAGGPAPAGPRRARRAGRSRGPRRHRCGQLGLGPRPGQREVELGLEHGERCPELVAGLVDEAVLRSSAACCRSSRPFSVSASRAARRRVGGHRQPACGSVSESSCRPSPHPLDRSQRAARRRPAHNGRQEQGRQPADDQ